MLQNYANVYNTDIDIGRTEFWILAALYNYTVIQKIIFGGERGSFKIFRPQTGAALGSCHFATALGRLWYMSHFFYTQL